MTRRFAMLRKEFQAPHPDTASAQGRADYAEYLKLQAKIEQKRDESKNELAQLDRKKLVITTRGQPPVAATAPAPSQADSAQPEGPAPKKA